jgi:hypothetical protein
MQEGSRRLWLLGIVTLFGCRAPKTDTADTVDSGDTAPDSGDSGDSGPLDTGDPGDTAEPGDTEDTGEPAEPTFDWYFSLHVGEVEYDLELAVQAFDEIKALGGMGVRTDVYWYDVEPAQGEWDEDMLAFYDAFVSLALEHEVEPMIIVSNAPDWAKDLYGSDEDAFWERYELYVDKVGSLVADRATHYQVWNEPNHIIDPFDGDDDWQLYARGGQVLRDLDPDAVLYCNVMANLTGWEEAVTDWVEGAGEYIDVIGVDHYPGTWAVSAYSAWEPLETLIERINDPDDAWYGKAGAVMETGYSSWAALVADEEDQQEWINESLPAMLELVREANATQEHGVWLGNYYQLIDVDTDGIGQEAHFGILHSDFEHKTGYPDLQTQIATFEEL